MSIPSSVMKHSDEIPSCGGDGNTLAFKEISKVGKKFLSWGTWPIMAG